MANILEMSDDDLMKMTPSEIEAMAAVPAPVDHAGDDGEEENQPEGDLDADPEADQQSQDDQPQTPGTDSATEPQVEQEQDEPSAPAAPENDQAEPTTPAEGGEVKPEVPQRDYEQEVARILSPIKANGRSIQVDSVDDAIQLMQMGANYHKKMEGLKPNIAKLKLLEREGLLDEEKLSHLIDLAKGDTGAINKLIKDKNIDLLSLDADKANEYKVSAYNVNLKEVDLENVIEELRESAHYPNLIDTVGNKWDSASQKIIADNPEILKTIHGHMESGIFDKIQERMHTEKALGRLQGLSALEAYRTVGDRLNSEGKFTSPKAITAPQVVAAVKPATVKPVDDKNKERKLAASGTKGTPSKNTDLPIDPLSMSDEDFEKMYKAKFNTR